MTVKRRTFGSLPSIFDDLYDKDYSDKYPAFDATMPLINIRESLKEFIIEVAAPGLEREDFKINLDNNYILSISVEKEIQTRGNDKFTRQEFSYHSFRRSFTLPRQVETTKINASYKNGLLIITVPKVPEENKSQSRKIDIR